MVEKRRRRESSQRGFVLALEWLKGNLEVETGTGKKPEKGLSTKSRGIKKESRRNDKGRRRKGVESEQRRQVWKSGLGKNSAPQKLKFSCSECGRILGNLGAYTVHRRACQAEREWTGLEVTLCHGCGITYDDGTPFVECEGCNIWHHQACVGVTDLDAQWFCDSCEIERKGPSMPIEEASEKAKPVKQSKPRKEMEEVTLTQDSKQMSDVTLLPDEDLAICEVCLEGHDAEKLFLCDSCNRGFHTYCMNDEMTQPSDGEGEWFCANRCANNISGFEKQLREDLIGVNSRLNLSNMEGEEVISIEMLDGKTAPELGNGAKELLIEAFGRKNGTTGMDIGYIEASLESRKGESWDNSLHRTLLLHNDLQVLSVCTFRVLGDNAAAEIIFAATHPDRRKSGLFRKLHDLLILTLEKFNVRNFIIHATAKTQPHFLRYKGRVCCTGHPNDECYVEINYQHLMMENYDHRRLFPRLLEMGSKLLITNLF